MPGDALGCTFVRVVAKHGVVLGKCHGIVAIPGQGIAPWHAALTDSDVVTVTNAPVTVDLICLLRPVMSLALMSCCSINEVTSDWTGEDSETKCPDDDCCKDVLCFNHDAVV